MKRRYSAGTHVLVAIALLAVLGHVCVLPGHVHAATPSSHHPSAAPESHHEHSDGDGVHAASCEAIRSGAANAGTPTLVATSPRPPAFDNVVDTPLRVAESAPPTSSPPLYLTHRALLI
jgi:hypothetical protein